MDESSYQTSNNLHFLNSLSAGASVEWKRDTTMPYPNVTVCFAKYFDSRLMAGNFICLQNITLTTKNTYHNLNQGCTTQISTDMFHLFISSKQIKWQKFWALRNKFKSSAAHIWPAGHMLCLPGFNKQYRRVILAL